VNSFPRAKTSDRSPNNCGRCNLPRKEALRDGRWAATTWSKPGWGSLLLKPLCAGPVFESLPWPAAGYARSDNGQGFRANDLLAPLHKLHSAALRSDKISEPKPRPRSKVPRETGGVSDVNFFFFFFFFFCRRFSGFYLPLGLFGSETLDPEEVALFMTVPEGLAERRLNQTRGNGRQVSSAICTWRFFLWRSPIAFWKIKRAGASPRHAAAFSRRQSGRAIQQKRPERQLN